MKLHVHERLGGLHPSHAFRRWRDEIVHRAASLPNVRRLRERERTELRRLLEWALDVEIPLVARAFVPSDALVLELDEQWDDQAPGCAWQLRSRGLPEGAACANGLLRFDDTGLLVTGDVTVDLAAVPHLPPALARSAGPALERSLARAIENAWGQLARTMI